MINVLIIALINIGFLDWWPYLQFFSFRPAVTDKQSVTFGPVTPSKIISLPKKIWSMSGEGLWMILKEYGLNFTKIPEDPELIFFTS